MLPPVTLVVPIPRHIDSSARCLLASLISISSRRHSLALPDWHIFKGSMLCSFRSPFQFHLYLDGAQYTQYIVMHLLCLARFNSFILRMQLPGIHTAQIVHVPLHLRQHPQLRRWALNDLHVDVPIENPRVG